MSREEQLEKKLTELKDLKDLLHRNSAALNDRGFRSQVDGIFLVVSDLLELLAGKGGEGE